MHQGVIAEVEQFPLTELPDALSITQHEQGPAFFLVLDSIQDPHNFGTLIRSAVCSGARAVIFPRDRAAGLTAAVAKASAGAIEHITLCRVTNIAAALDEMKQSGLWIFGLAPGGNTPLFGCDFTGDTAIVIGSEGKGMRPLVQKKCDCLAAIPMAAPFESLNASAAGAVAMFEVMRQRRAQ
jgi:23S rRNA (guanosine2251-2'-O)-methyltransferase